MRAYNTGIKGTAVHTKQAPHSGLNKEVMASNELIYIHKKSEQHCSNKYLKP